MACILECDAFDQRSLTVHYLSIMPQRDNFSVPSTLKHISCLFSFEIPEILNEIIAKLLKVSLKVSCYDRFHKMNT